MPQHTIQQGECPSSLGKQYGLYWRTIWNHPENTELRNRRQDPNTLCPGDTLWIPERHEKRESGSTETRHRFRKKGTPAKFRLHLLREGEPRANLPYVLNIDGQLLEGETDGRGWLEHSIPPDARQGRLSLKHGSEIYVFQLGHLDPLEEITGVQQRLQNLGLYGGDVSGQMNDETHAALAAFQTQRGLEATGELDPPTRNALKDLHQG